MGTYVAAEVVLELVTEAYLRGRYDGNVLEHQAAAETPSEPKATQQMRVANRLDEMDRAARERAARAGREYTVYQGGPVEWETGKPRLSADNDDDAAGL